jgi:hypothetical protein
MKKIIFFAAFILIALSGFAQKPTSDDVLNQIKTKVGKGHVLFTQTISDMVWQYNTLRMQELRNKPQKDKIANNPIGGGGSGPFCFFCRCKWQGHEGASSSCTNSPIQCSGNCSCGCTEWNVYISMCEGGVCNW